MKILFYSPSAEDLYRYRLPVARRLREAGYAILFAGPSGEFAARVEQEGIRYTRVGGSRGGTSLLRDAVIGLQLGRIYRKVDPDIVHHFMVHGMVRGAIAARLAHEYWVVQSVPPLADGSGRMRNPPAPSRLALRAALRGAEVTFRTYEDRQLLVSRGLVRPEQTHIIASSGIEIADYPAADEPDRDPVVALIGSLSDGSAIQTFVDAARRVRANHPDARFVLAATSRDRPSVPESTLNAWQEEGAIEWWGRRRDAAHVLATVHVACMTESYSGELPYLMLEAAAVGRPIVAVDDAAVRSLVRDGDTGLTVPRHDARALTQALEVLLDDPDRRRCIGRNARRLVESEFSADHVAQQTMAVYETLFLKGRQV